MPVGGDVRLRAPESTKARRLGEWIVFGVAPLLVFCLSLAVAISGDRWGFDFHQFWQGGRDVLDGISPYPSDALLATAGDHLDPVGIQEVFRFPYPAGAAIAFAPFGALAFDAASAVWGVVLIASVLGSLWILSVRDWRVFGVVLGSAAVIGAVGVGTLTPVLLLLLAVAWRWRDRAWVVAGSLALAIALKLFLWPLVVWLAATRRWTAALGTVALAVAATLVAWAAIGFDGFADYPDLVRRLTDVVARSRVLARCARSRARPARARGRGASLVGRLTASGCARARLAPGGRRPEGVLTCDRRGGRPHSDRVAPLLRAPARPARAGLAHACLAVAPAVDLLADTCSGERRRSVANRARSRHHRRDPRRHRRAPPQGGRDGMTSRSAAEARAASMAIPARAILLVAIAVATVVHAVVALRSPSPWIVPDELIYSELAKSLGDFGAPEIRGEVSLAYGLAYPALLAPVWAVFDNPSTAYAVAKVLNALVLGLTAVPAYFLARRFVSSGYSLLVAALAVAVPSLLYAGVLMTEVALYPAFVLALLGITAALERPRPATQAGALGAIALASTVKLLAAVLVAAYLARDLRSLVARPAGKLRKSRVVTCVCPDVERALAAIAVVGVLLAAVADRGSADLLGAYGVVLENLDLTAVPWCALVHACRELVDLSRRRDSVRGDAHGLVALRARRVADSRERLFFALSLPCCVALLAVVSGFASTPSPGGAAYPENVTRIHERSTFVLAPLLFLGLALWLRTPPGRQGVFLLCVTCAALLPAVVPLEDLGKRELPGSRARALGRRARLGRVALGRSGLHHRARSALRIGRSSPRARRCPGRSSVDPRC